MPMTMPQRVIRTVRFEWPIPSVSKISRPIAVPMVWNWLESVLMAADRRVIRKITPNHLGKALLM